MSDEQTAATDDNQRLLEAVRRERAEAEERERERDRASHALRVHMQTPTTFTASCACGMWALENNQVSHPIDAEAARLLVAARHEEHRDQADVKMELSRSEGRCTSFRMINKKGVAVTHGTLLASRAPRTRCQFCKTNWSTGRCDYPTGGKCRKCKGTGLRHIGSLEVTDETLTDGIRAFTCFDCAGTGRAMCNKRICAECGVHREPDEDYCPDHRERAGFGPPLLKREVCRWETAPRIVNRKCLRESCSTILNADDRVLYFPRRSRGMCQGCGDHYLSISK